MSEEQSVVNSQLFAVMYGWSSMDNLKIWKCLLSKLHSTQNITCSYFEIMSFCLVPNPGISLHLYLLHSVNTNIYKTKMSKS